MARKMIRFGGWYVAYELASTALVMGVLASGVRFPGF